MASSPDIATGGKASAPGSATAEYRLALSGQPGARGYATLEEALAAAAAWSPALDDTAGAAPHLTIARAPAPGGRRPRRRYEFFVNLRGQGGGGDGSELMPWWGSSAAVDDLTQRHAGGRLSLAPGQSLRLWHREVFAASRRERRKRLVEAIVRYALLAVALSLVLPMAAVLVHLVAKAWPALSLSFLFDNPTNRMTAGGIWAPLVGTLYLVVISLGVAAVVGVAAGIYLNEYARDTWLTRLINLAVVNLAGVPSIVHALFGVGAFVMFMHMRRSVLAASCTLAVMTLPVIITSTREALAAVPMAFREACWNMGATRWQTIRTIVLPNSFSGILTGVILQVSRAAGETAPVLFTGAVFYVTVADSGWESLAPYGLLDRCMSLSMHLFTLSTQVTNVPEPVVYGTAVVLIGLVLAVNSVSIGLRVYLRGRKRW